MDTTGAATIRVPIDGELDIVTARHAGRELAATAGFSSSDQTLIATAISEVARNIIVYARHGEVLVGRIEHDGLVGIQVIACDRGPGIENVELVLRDRASTKPSLGLGLAGTRRLMDDFTLQSELGHGTTITMRKWRR
jgi:serine/threonine-protein kinase RsbT